MAEVINFFNVKGGSGKSSLSYLTAKFLASQGHKILLVDIDPQRSISRIFNGKYQHTVFDYLMDSCSIKNTIFSSDAIPENMSLIPADLRLLRIQNNITQDQLKNGLNICQEYDYIILDNAPTYNNLIVAGIYASHKVVVPSQVSIFDLEEIDFVIRECKKVQDSARIYVVLNRVQSAERTSRNEADYLDLFKEQLEQYIMKNKIPNSPLVRRIVDRNESLAGHNKSKTIFRHNFADFIMELTEKEIDCAVF